MSLANGIDERDCQTEEIEDTILIFQELKERLIKSRGQESFEEKEKSDDLIKRVDEGIACHKEKLRKRYDYLLSLV